MNRTRYMPDESITPRVSAPLTTRTRPAEMLSDLERSVILLSRADTLSSIPDLPGWRARLVRKISGGSKTTTLADNRLEQLRRFAIKVRSLHDVDDEGLVQFLDAGYSLEHAALIERIIHERTIVDTTYGRIAIGWIIPLCFAAGIYSIAHLLTQAVTLSGIAAALAFLASASISLPSDHGQ